LTSFPRITVVTANLNGGAYLEAALKSVLDQNYPNLQYIVVDGMSTDDSPAIIDRYRDRLTLVIREPDDGHGEALDKGFAKADGEIMCWLNSDDLQLPWTLSTVAEIFSTLPEVSWIEGRPAHWDEHGRLYVTPDNTEPINQFDYLVGRFEWIQQESTFWRRSLWQATGAALDTSYRFAIDGELWTRFFLRARLYRSDYILGGFRIHETNRSSLNMASLTTETRRAIASMRDKSDPKLVNDADRYRRFRHFRRLGIGPLRGALLERRAYRPPSDFIRRTNGRWRTSDQP
jgi:glycosyltransferase involved in cell wall biosynthesis